MNASEQAAASEPPEGAALFARLRAVFDERDPVPADLVERMVAAVAVADLSTEYALLTLVEDAASAVRGDAETTTLQFSDGTASVLLHISRATDRRRRLDGWVEADAEEILLEQGARTWTTVPDGNGRFVFDGIPPGLARVRITTPADAKDLATGRFEL